MRTDFRVYKRKIHVYVRQPGESPSSKLWMYMHSTNAFKTCKDAVKNAGIGKDSYLEFRAWFAKD